MASLRRNNTLSTESQTARFLYTIIKQLDLKSIDWNLVAASHGVTNGHAARMRYSRFRSHMEGVTTQQRGGKAGGKKEKEGKEGKEGKEAPKKGKKRGLDEDGQEKGEAGPVMKREKITKPDGAGVRIKREAEIPIKNEPDTDTAPVGGVHIKTEPGLVVPHAPTTAAQPAMRVKPEPTDDSNTYTTNPDIWRILPQTHPNNQQSPLLNQTTATPRSNPPQAPFALDTIQSPTPSPLFSTQQKTVSLADLDLSPRQQPATITRHADAGAFLRHTFGHDGETAVVGGLGRGCSGSGSGSGSGSVTVKKEEEAGLDGNCVMGATVVKKEPRIGGSWMEEGWDGGWGCGEGVLS